MSIIKGTGYLPDPVDPRDRTVDHPRVAPLVARLNLAAAEALPPAVDLREWFTPVVDQEHINACTSNAAAGVIGYFENRAFGTALPPSRLFIYKAARNLLFTTADSGVYLRTTMQAMVMFGAPPETFWPYLTELANVEPPAFCYSFASNYRATNYYRYDPPGIPREELLYRIKAHLHAKLPAMFGFMVFPSSYQAVFNGKIPYPAPGEMPMDGHAMVTAGYDDNMVVENVNPTTGVTLRTTGAFLVRNCWGTGWGQGGYGYLPYEYVLNNLANDWWSLLKQEWIDTGNFGGVPQM